MGKSCNKGTNNPFFGKHHTKAQKEKVSKKLRGKNSRWWKGGRWIRKDGYVAVTVYNHPHPTSRNCVLEHRLVMEKKLGRYLKPEEIVHHFNGIRDDNRPENLGLTNKKKHEKQTLYKLAQKRIKQLEKQLRGKK